MEHGDYVRATTARFPKAWLVSYVRDFQITDAGLVQRYASRDVWEVLTEVLPGMILAADPITCCSGVRTSTLNDQLPEDSLLL